MKRAMATTSSMASGIISSMRRAVRRQRLHQVPTSTGCKMTRTMLVTPSGITRIPNMRTIHGIIRQRSCQPMKPERVSSK